GGTRTRGRPPPAGLEWRPHSRGRGTAVRRRRGTAPPRRRRRAAPRSPPRSRRHTTERGRDPVCATGAVGRGATLPLVEERYESELARSAAVLDGVDRALDRLSEGTY